MADLSKKPVKICNDRFLLKLTKDKLKATLQLVNENDNFDGVDFNEILKEVQVQGVCYGFVSRLPPARDGLTVVASGKPPVPGENAKIRPIIKPFIQKPPKVDKAGQDKVDYRELGNIVNVPAGQLLLEKIPLTSGSPGKSVLGVEISTKAGKDITIKCGPGVKLSDDGFQLHATVDGKFVMGEGKASVIEKHTVQGDVDMSVGNIAFFGSSLEIQGEVLSGFKIKCKGDIFVAKGVHSAEVTAGGNLSIMGGLNGEDALIRAKGNISIDFCDNFGLIEALGSVKVSKFLIQGKVRAGKDLSVIDGKGSVIGGEYIAGGSMYVNELGSDAEVVTKVTVGLKPELEKKKRKIQAAKEYWPGKMSEILKNIKAINEMKKQEGKNFGGEKAKILDELTSMMPEVVEKNNQLVEMEEQLEEAISKAANECVYVYGTLFPGVFINIGKASRLINKAEKQVVAELDKKTLKIYIRPMTSEEKR